MFVLFTCLLIFLVLKGQQKHNLPGGATRGRHRVTTGRCAGASRTGRHWNGEVGLLESELELKLLAAHQIPFLGVGGSVQNPVASITTVSLRKRNYVIDYVLQGRHKSLPIYSSTPLPPQPIIPMGVGNFDRNIFRENAMFSSLSFKGCVWHPLSNSALPVT